MMSTFILKINQGKVAGGLIELPLSYYSYNSHGGNKKLVYDGTKIDITSLDDLILAKHGGNYVIKYKSGKPIVNSIVVNEKSIIGKDKSDIITLLDSYNDCKISVKNIQHDRKNFALELSCATGDNKKKAMLSFINFKDLGSRILTRYTYLTIKKDEKNGRYIGCISDEYGTCGKLISNSDFLYQIPMDNI